MPQIPALFLPKNPDKRRTQTKEPKKQEKAKRGSEKKISALLKGRIDGYKEDNSQIYRAAR